MVKQYPHSVSLTVPQSAQQDANGNWKSNVGTETNTTLSGRAEPAKNNAFIIGADGKQIHYSCIVYLPLPVETVSPGTLIEVKDGDRLISKGSVLQFSKGQLNARLWV